MEGGREEGCENEGVSRESEGIITYSQSSVPPMKAPTIGTAGALREDVANDRSKTRLATRMGPIMTEN